MAGILGSVSQASEQWCSGYEKNSSVRPCFNLNGGPRSGEGYSLLAKAIAHYKK